MSLAHPSLKVYGRLWCLHQLVPFVDKALGLAGAMDNRMLGPNDVPFRLPVILATLAFPNNQMLLAAHIVNVVSWAYWMPAVWDYMCWCALMEMTFIAAALMGGSDEAVAKRFIPAFKAELIILYFSAAFWKLTSSWFDTRSSCAVILMSELLSSRVFTHVPEAFCQLMLSLSPILVAALEFAVPIALWLCPRFGVPLALVFHQTINLMPMTYAGGFSISMCTRLHIFLPGLAARDGASWLVPAAIVGPILALMWAVHNRLDAAGSLFMILTFVYARPCLFPDPKAAPYAEGSAWLRRLAWLVGFLYGFVGPVVGIQAMASSTMYGNVIQFAGWGNHWVVPTGLLQTHFADRTPNPAGPWFEEALVDAFGGGHVRVESTTSSVMRRLSPAEATAQLPPRAKSLLPLVNSTGRYFEMYAARNYFERPMFNLTATALFAAGDQAKEQPLTYVVNAYELRRVLALAREREESFKLTYTKIPTSVVKVSEFRKYQGTQVELVEEDGKTIKCSVKDGGSVTECGPHEVAMMPEPPKWLQWVLHPYPIPLIPYETHDEIHCST